MPEWLTSFLTGFTTSMASGIWNAAMGLISGLVTTTPQGFSADTWSFVSDTLYPWSLAIGISMLNLFFMIGIFNAAIKFHQNITLERIVEVLIKVVAANALFLNLKNLMVSIFSAASLMSASVFTMQAPELVTSDIDVGSVLFYQLFGILFLIASIACSGILLLTVYQRYLKLYLLVVIAPFSVGTLVAGNGVERTFYAWLKTFLANVFEIVVIALTMVISFKLIQGGLTIFDGTNIVTEAVDGFWDALNSLFTMVFMTASVKGANAFLAKALGLQ